MLSDADGTRTESDSIGDVEVRFRTSAVGIDPNRDLKDLPRVLAISTRCFVSNARHAHVPLLELPPVISQSTTGVG